LLATRQRDDGVELWGPTCQDVRWQTQAKAAAMSGGVGWTGASSTRPVRGAYQRELAPRHCSAG
jgi:hypothetical protein